MIPLLKRIFLKRTGISLVFVILLSSHAVANPTGNQVEQIEQLNQQIEEAMLLNKNQVEGGEYARANETSDAILQGVGILIDAFMPVDERLKQLIENEISIRYRTNTASDHQGNRYRQADELIHDQIANREKTEETSELIGKQIANPNQTDDQNKKAANENKQALFAEIKQLLTDSAKLQTDVIAHLEEKQFSAALPKEDQAIAKLKDALEKLKKDSQSDQKQNDQQSQAGQNQPRSQEKDQKNQEDKSRSETEPKAAAKEQKSMSAKDALKELARLRKEAEDEMKRRQEKYGIAISPDQVPVEKDW